MIKISSEKISDETEPIFEIDGQTFTIRKRFPRNLSVQALDLVRTHGEVYATAWCMETALGESGALAALKDCDTLTEADLAAVTTIVRDKFFGVIEAEGKG